jgi:tetratricopeptide (TPR) repeat protein
MMLKLLLSTGRLALGGAAALFFLAGPVRAQAGGDLESANQAYSAGHYDDAAKMFRGLIDSEGYSAPLCFNLANADAKAGHVGAALLNYERARHLAPRDAEIDHNLQLERQKAGLKPNSYRWWQALLLSIDWNVLFALIVGGLVLIIAAIVATRLGEAGAAVFRAEPRAWHRAWKTVLFVALPVTLLLFFVELSAIGFENRIEGVITASNAVLRLSPFDSAEQTGTIPEGELVTVEERHDDYLRIEARDRQFGWIQQKLIEPVVPGSFDQK